MAGEARSPSPHDEVFHSISRSASRNGRSKSPGDGAIPRSHATLAAWAKDYDPKAREKSRSKSPKDETIRRSRSPEDEAIRRSKSKDETIRRSKSPEDEAIRRSKSPDDDAIPRTHATLAAWAKDYDPKAREKSRKDKSGNAEGNRKDPNVEGNRSKSRGGHKDPDRSPGKEGDRGEGPDRSRSKGADRSKGEGESAEPEDPGVGADIRVETKAKQERLQEAVMTAERALAAIGMLLTSKSAPFGGPSNYTLGKSDVRCLKEIAKRPFDYDSIQECKVICDKAGAACPSALAAYMKSWRVLHEELHESDYKELYGQFKAFGRFAKTLQVGALAGQLALASSSDSAVAASADTFLRQYLPPEKYKEFEERLKDRKTGGRRSWEALLNSSVDALYGASFAGGAGLAAAAAAAAPLTIGGMAVTAPVAVAAGAVMMGTPVIAKIHKYYRNSGEEKQRAMEKGIEEAAVDFLSAMRNEQMHRSSLV